MSNGRKVGLRLVRGAETAAAKTGTVTVNDGTRIYFQDTGGEGVPLVFLYGLGCSIQHWKYPIRALTHGSKKMKSYRCIWSDIRGHGKSSMPPKNRLITLDDVINDQMAVLNHLNVTSAVFLGQSMGGCLAMELAYRYPATSSGLVLLGAPARDPSRLLPFQPVSKFLWDTMISLNETMPFLVRSIYDRLIPAVQKNPLQLLFREMIRKKGFNNKLAKTTDIEEYIAAIFKVPPNVFYQMASTLSGYDINRYEGKVLTPALIMVGAQDQIIPPSEGEYIHQQLRNSELKLIPHGSHCPHFDDPVLVSGLIRQFLGKQTFN
jgi:3-oxoadipate enol-lactonase